VKRVEWQVNLVDRAAEQGSIKVSAVLGGGGARFVLRASGRRVAVPTPSANAGLMPRTIVKGSKARKHQATAITAKDFHLWRFSIPEFLDPADGIPVSSAF
jgi:hypothetical protein